MAWKQVWKSSWFAVDVEWSYSQNKVANKTTYTVHQLRIRSLTSSSDIYVSRAVAGIATITAQRKTSSPHKISLKGNGTVTLNLANDSRTFSHGSSGATPAEVNVHGYLDVNLSGSNFPAGGWKVANVAGSIPDIDRKPPSANGLSLSSSTYNSLTIKMDCSAACNYAAYRLNGGSWQYFTPPAAIVDNTGSATKTITGLSPNTTYKVEVAYRRTMNHVWGYSAAVNMTTKKPNPPTCNTPILVSKTHKSVTFNLSGAYGAGHGSGGGYYQYGIDGVLSWTRGGNAGNVITGLKPNTTYRIRAQLVDAYGQAGEATPLTVTTNKPPIPTAGKVSISNIDYDSATATISGFVMGDMASLANYRYKVLNSEGTEVIPLKAIGASTTISLTGLTPATSYTIYVDAVDNYGQSNSGWATAAFETLNPSKPTPGHIEILEVTTTSIKAQLVGYGTGQGIALKNISFNFNGTGYTDIGTRDTVDLPGLNPETTYTLQFKVTDEFDNEASTPIEDITTLSDKFVYIIDGATTGQTPSYDMFIIQEPSPNSSPGRKEVTKITKQDIALIE